MQGITKEWILWLSAACSTTLILALTLVWLNIERMDLAYELRELHKKMGDLESHTAKLSIERDNLISPQRLRKLAQEYGLGAAKQGQIRRVHKTEDVGKPL